MLRHARMAGLAKLRRSIRSTDERQLRAVHVDRGEIDWQDRCDAANGSKEPKLTGCRNETNVSFTNMTGYGRLGWTVLARRYFRCVGQTLELSLRHYDPDCVGVAKRAQFPSLRTSNFTIAWLHKSHS